MKELKIIKQITNRESESLEKYFLEIGKVRMITAEEEVNLAKRIHEGDNLALEKLTKANLRFVVSVAKQYQHRGLPLNDLINEGNLGLIKAGQRFDETRGFKFISYAVWWIRQSIISALAQQSRMVRLPMNRVGSLSQIIRMSAQLEQDLQREPTPAELAESLDTTVENIEDTLYASQKTISADAPVHVDDQSTLLDTLTDSNSAPPDNSLMLHSLNSEIGRALSILSSRDKEVIILYYGLNGTEKLSLEEIGTKFSLTRERVRQIKERSTRAIRKSTSAKALRYFL